MTKKIESLIAVKDASKRYYKFLCLGEEVKVVDPRAGVESINVAVEALEKLDAWLDAEIETEEGEEKYRAMKADPFQGFRVGE